MFGNNLKYLYILILLFLFLNYIGELGKFNHVFYDKFGHVYKELDLPVSSGIGDRITVSWNPSSL